MDEKVAEVNLNVFVPVYTDDYGTIENKEVGKIIMTREIYEKIQWSTIRHNRARGSHNIELMSNIVTELVESGMGDAWIAKHLGMDLDEILRLKQITGLAALFKDKEFSRSWDAK